MLHVNNAQLPATSYNLRVIGDVNHDGKVDGVDASFITNAFGTRTGDTRYDLKTSRLSQNQVD